MNIFLFLFFNSQLNYSVLKLFTGLRIAALPVGYYMIDVIMVFMKLIIREFIFYPEENKDGAYHGKAKEVGK